MTEQKEPKTALQKTLEWIEDGKEKSYKDNYLFLKLPEKDGKETGYIFANRHYAEIRLHTGNGVDMCMTIFNAE